MSDRFPSVPGVRPVRAGALRLPRPVVAAMREHLPEVAERVIDSVMREVPAYSEPFRGRMGRNIEVAVTMTLGGFLDLASSEEGVGFGARVGTVFEAAHALGRGEARSGRSMDALVSAYRVGARVAWHDLSAVAVGAGLPAGEVAKFAELVFDFIDQLSAVSVSGHAEESATTGRVRQRRREQLAASLLAGATTDRLLELAERAEWVPPQTLTAVVLPVAAVGDVTSRLDPGTLRAGEAAPGLEEHDHLTVLLVPDQGGSARAVLRRAMGTHDAVLGPTRPWEAARASYERALRVVLLASGGEGPRDADDHLAELVLTADPEALDDLRSRVLAPLAGLRPATRQKLIETLRAWLLHQGRREEVAAALFVHPQTVRYRMGQLREAYAERLEDPDLVRDLVVALAVPGRLSP